MSATGKTENFNLPLYNADDATSWLVDFNGAMSDIDTHLKTLTDNVSTDGEDLDNLENSVNNINRTLTQLTDSVIKVQENGKSNSTAITLLQTHSNETDTRLDNVDAEIDGLRNTYEKYENITIGNVSQYFTIKKAGLKIGKSAYGKATKYEAYLCFTFDITSGYEIKKGIHLELSEIPHLSDIMANQSEFETMNISAWGWNNNPIPLEIDCLLGARFNDIYLRFTGDNTEDNPTLPTNDSNYVCIKISGLLEG